MADRRRCSATEHYTDLFTVLSYLLMKIGDLHIKSPPKCPPWVYHSNNLVELKDPMKRSIKFDNGPVRMVLAISAISLGVNFKNIRYVIHYGPAPDLKSQL